HQRVPDLGEAPRVEWRSAPRVLDGVGLCHWGGCSLPARRIFHVVYPAGRLDVVDGCGTCPVSHWTCRPQDHRISHHISVYDDSAPSISLPGAVRKIAVDLIGARSGLPSACGGDGFSRRQCDRPWTDPVASGGGMQRAAVSLSARLTGAPLCVPIQRSALETH